MSESKMIFMEGDENAQKFHAKLNKEYQIIFLP